jgi:hypothetical protein
MCGHQVRINIKVFLKLLASDVKKNECGNCSQNEKLKNIKNNL